LPGPIRPLVLGAIFPWYIGRRNDSVKSNLQVWYRFVLDIPAGNSLTRDVLYCHRVQDIQILT